jgi:hypothetical protein
MCLRTFPWFWARLDTFKSVPAAANMTVTPPVWIQKKKWNMSHQRESSGHAVELKYRKE